MADMSKLQFWHIGYLTHDFDAAAKAMSQLPGMGRLEPVEIGFDEQEMEMSEPFAVKTATAMFGDLLIEIIQPLDPNTCVGRELAKRGEGIHHLAYAVPGGFDALVAQLEAEGWTRMMAANKGGVRNCYIASPDRVTVLELIERIPD